jgi:hypothetical protein
MDLQPSQLTGSDVQYIQKKLLGTEYPFYMVIRLLY